MARPCKRRIDCPGLSVVLVCELVSWAHLIAVKHQRPLRCWRRWVRGKRRSNQRAEARTTGGGCKNTWGYKQVRSVGAPLECSTSLYHTTNINEVRMLLILTNYHKVNPTQDTDTSHVSYHVCLSVSLSAFVCLCSLSFSRSVSLYVSMSVSMSIVLLPGGS